MSDQAIALTVGLVALLLEHMRARNVATRDDLAALAERVARLEGREP
jgi:hypothetical protein